MVGLMIRILKLDLNFANNGIYSLTAVARAKAEAAFRYYAYSIPETTQPRE